MSDYYALDDVTDTWTLGRRLSNLDRTARAGGHVLTTALDEVHVGTDDACQSLRGQLGEFQEECVTKSNECAESVRELGDGITEGAVTAADTNEEGTQRAEKMVNLARTLNTFTSAPARAD